MFVKEIGERGVLFTFSGKDFPYLGDTSVYLINTGRFFFVCDTHLGSASMEPIRRYMHEKRENKPAIVFNSHSDWDHVWGNCAFEESLIVGHETCRRRLKEIGDFELQIYSQYQNGNVKILLPNITFTSSLTYEDGEVEFLYAPGHTVDSAVCFDKRDSVLYTGDMVEYPIPCLDFLDLESYIKSLERIKDLRAKIIISAHSGIVDEKLIDDNITYIKSVLSGNPIDFKHDEFKSRHDYNIKNLLILKYEKIAREKLKEKFDYKSFRRGVLNIDHMSCEELKKALEV
ncbi:MAG: MBL fold metallo-hydrolase [Tepidanaerobacteraceae bacterium]|jgi:glyoxylase-like metal-dependent hydrolase (beta-lactamase superfamily II)|nr:MBL fold metallo-hydrolase [Tepidanaerobacteraceae bacterium]